MRGLLLCIAGLLPATAAFSAPTWTFGTDADGRLCLVAAASEYDDFLEVPATHGGNPVRSIGPRAWAGCPALRSVYVPADIEWIDPDAFQGCPSLERIVVDAANPVYSDMGGVLFDADGGYLLTCPEGFAGAYVVPAGTAEIDDGAFAGCAHLGSVALPGGIDRVGAGAFRGCTSLALLSVPESAPYNTAELGLPAGCRVVRFRAGSLDDPTLPSRWAVDFKANGGTGSMPEQVVVCGTPAALRANAFRRAGFHFAGWSRSPGGAVAFPDRQTVRDLAAAGARTALYAQWAANSYTVRFHPNGGTGTMADETFAWGAANELRRNAFSRKGYEFAGWSTTKGGAVAFQDGQSVKNLVAADGGAVTLYATWRGVAYKVAFHENDGAPAGATQSFRYGKRKPLRANPFPKEGLTFLGWARKRGGPIVYSDAQAVANLASVAGKTVHLYARWAVTRFAVRFDPDGGDGTMADQAFRYGKAKRLRANSFKRKGFTFVGWAKQPGGAVKYAERKKVRNLTKDGGTVVLYAVWRRNRYKVRFVANGGTGAMANQSFAWGRKKALRACSFTREDSIFAGWSKSPSGAVLYANGATVSDLTAKDGKIVRLYAQWIRAHYKVRFDANGGTGTMADQSFAWGTSGRLRRNAFVREGWRFIGWSRSATAARPTYRDRASVLNLSSKGKRIVLHAVWIPEPAASVVLCLGDSITQGFRCIGSPYPTRLAQMTGRAVPNYGLGGAKSAYGVEIAEEAIWRERPAVVCIQFGANDAIHSLPVSTTIANLRAIVRTCKANGAVPLLATPTPQVGSHAKFNAGVQAIASAVRALAAVEGVRCVDLNAAFGSGAGYLNPDDGLHLSDAGGDLMARMFRDALP